MPTYRIKNLTSGSSVYVKTYHGIGYALSIGIIDKYKDAFVLDVNELRILVDHAAEITILAKDLAKPDLRGTIAIWRKSTTPVASWPSQTSDLVVKDWPARNYLTIGSPTANDVFP
jgi:hypothetical protein